jgi:tetratricopeptide (TPR) repeat protein
VKVIGKKLAGGGHADADTLRLMRLVEAQKYVDVERVAREILARNPRHPLALKALSFALIGLRRYEELMPVVDFALSQQPEDGELHNNRAIALAELMRWEEAIAEFGLASRTHMPNDAGDPQKPGHGPVPDQSLERRGAFSCSRPSNFIPDDYLEAVEVLAKSLYYARRMDEAYAVCRAMHEEPTPTIPTPCTDLPTSSCIVAAGPI